MAKKATARKTKSVGVRGGTPAQHARAGRLGGLAPHVCRGSECTKLKKEAAMRGKKKTALKAAPHKKTTASRRAPYEALFENWWEEDTPVVTRRAAAKKATHKAKKTAARANHW